MELTLDQALQQGVAAHKEGKLQDAERLYRAILEAQPSHPDANHNLGALAVAVGKPLEAIPLFKLALEANPKVEQFWLSYIDVLMRLERFDEAKRVLVEGEKSGISEEKLDALNQRLQPGAPNGNIKVAKGQTVSEKRQKLAGKKKRKERKERGNSSGAAPSQDQLSHLAEHYQANRLKEAAELATLLTQQFPKHPFGWKVLGVLLQQTGRVNESLLPLQESVDLSPQDAEAHSNLGNTLQELGRLDDAEASYRRAIALRPDLAQAHSNLGITLQELGRLDDAEASYRRAIALKPDYAEAPYNLGNTLQELGRLDDAEASYRRAIALKPDLAQAHSNLGITLQELGRLDDAEASHRRAIALKPDYAEAHYNLGNTLQALGRLDEAEESLRRVVAMTPDNVEAHGSLGNALRELGRLDEAETSYKKAIALKPDSAEAYINLTNTLTELGRVDDARESHISGLYYSASNASITTADVEAVIPKFLSKLEEQSGIPTFFDKSVELSLLGKSSETVDYLRIFEDGQVAKENRFITFWERLEAKAEASQSDSFFNGVSFQASQGLHSLIQWKNLSLFKTTFDLVLYWMLIQEVRPAVMIELGSGDGGSAVWFADIARALGLDTHVYSFDIDKPKIDHEKVTFVEYDLESRDIHVSLPHLDKFRGKKIIIEDAHVNLESVLRVCDKILESEDYLVVEDSAGKQEIIGNFLSEAVDRYRVDQFFLDFFGPNVTCSKNSIFKLV